MLHLYYGDGKGKTTAAMGLAIRSLGANKKVQVIQFLKDGVSSEVPVLEKLGVQVSYLKMPQRFVNMQDASMLKEVSALQEQLFSMLDSNYDVIVLDEILDAMQLYLLNEGHVYDVVSKLVENKEIIMTGRMPSHKFKQLASYSSHIKKQKHPYDQGIEARQGIEY